MADRFEFSEDTTGCDCPLALFKLKTFWRLLVAAVLLARTFELVVESGSVPMKLLMMLKLLLITLPLESKFWLSTRDGPLLLMFVCFGLCSALCRRPPLAVYCVPLIKFP